MGIYLNPGNENFRSMLRAPIYVDKTMMLKTLNDFMDRDNKYVCVSRPRRFGKTMAQNMIASYYSRGCDSHELFEKLKISKAHGFDEKLNKYNVIKIDLNSEYQNTINREKLIGRLTGKIRAEMSREYPALFFAEDDSLAECILNIYSATGETFIVLIDEYDVLVRAQVPQALFNDFLSFFIPSYNFSIPSVICLRPSSSSPAPS